MKRFDSLAHVTADGRWLGKHRRDARLETLLREMDRAEIDRACLVGIANFAENEAVASAAERHPDRFVPIAGFNPLAVSTPEAIEAAVEGFARGGFAGIKLHPRLNNYDPLHPLSLAAIEACGKHALPVFFCTLYRRSAASSRHPVDVVDVLATSCRNTRIILLHGGGTSMIDLFELVRMHEHLVLDLSFSIMRYAGSSIDLDLRFLLEHLDQRVVVGSDFPEYLPSDVFQRLDRLMDGLPQVKRENVMFRNLAELFSPTALLA